MGTLTIKKCLSVCFNSRNYHPQRVQSMIKDRQGYLHHMKHLIPLQLPKKQHRNDTGDGVCPISTCAYIFIHASTFFRPNRRLSFFLISILWSSIDTLTQLSPVFWFIDSLSTTLVVKYLTGVITSKQMYTLHTCTSQQGHCQSLKVILNRLHTFQTSHASLLQRNSVTKQGKHYSEQACYHTLKLALRILNSLHFQKS